jgi:hypothetical protein
LGAETVNDKPELVYNSEDGDVQLTDGGKVKTTDTVKLTGDQTITTGVKTFVVSPIVPTPTTDMQVATKKYVDDEMDVTTGHDHDGTNSKLLTGLGDWLDKSSSYGAQQATTDGFLLVSSTNASDNVTYIYTDGNSNPTTIRTKSQCNVGATITTSMLCPVKKNNYWKVTTTGTIVYVYWIPFGV